MLDKPDEKYLDFLTYLIRHADLQRDFEKLNDLKLLLDSDKKLKDLRIFALQNFGITDTEFYVLHYKIRYGKYPLESDDECTQHDLDEILKIESAFTKKDTSVKLLSSTNLENNEPIAKRLKTTQTTATSAEKLPNQLIDQLKQGLSQVNKILDGLTYQISNLS